MTNNKTYKNIIAGKLCDAISGKRLDVFSPSDGLGFASIPNSSKRDIDLAVKAARHAYENGPWSKLSATERGRILLKFSFLLEKHKNELAELESKDTGKILSQAMADISGLARYFEFYGGAADKLHGETIPLAGEFLALTLREPHGVVAGIIPWNFPSKILGRVVGAALAVGNTLVIKPAEDACLSVLRVGELAIMAGFPEGVFNIVAGTGIEAGAALSAHKDVDFIAFTGSPLTGTIIQQAAATNNRAVTMELGGKSAQIIFADADLDAALPVVVNALILNSGQVCSAGTRVLIEQSIYDEFTKKLAEKFSKLTAGPHDANLDLGPLISEKQLNIVKGFIEQAKKENIELLATGKIIENAPKGGHYIAPTLFGNVPPKSDLAQKEIFGPVLCAFPFKDEKHAIKLANDSEFGLVGAVWTTNGARQIRVAKQIRAGQIFINSYGAGDGNELPFGGFKKSGFGREKGFEAMLHMSATKTVIFNHSKN